MKFPEYKEINTRQSIVSFFNGKPFFHFSGFCSLYENITLANSNAYFFQMKKSEFPFSAVTICSVLSDRELMMPERLQSRV